MNLTQEDRECIVQALAEAHDNLILRSRLRANGGPRYKGYRAQLRAEAKRALALAERFANPEGVT